MTHASANREPDEAGAVSFGLSPDFKLGKAAKSFARAGLAVTASVLDPDAADALSAACAQAGGFQLRTLIDGEPAGFAIDELDEARRSAIESGAIAGAAHGFQYLFEDAGLEDDAPALADPVIRAAVDFVRSPDFIELGRKITWREEIVGAEAVLTRFRRGHFMRSTIGRAWNARKVAAWSIELTRDWRADFGGVLSFRTPDDTLRHGVVPAFNSFTVYSLPRPLAFSLVAPFAPHPRLALSGWFVTDA